MIRPSLARVTACACSLLAFPDGTIANAHEGHHAATYRVSPSSSEVQDQTHLRLSVVNKQSRDAVAARFTLTVDGAEYVPASLGKHGLRFVSIHQRKNQRFVATYSRGTGQVLIPLPPNAESGTVTVAKGFEFVPETVPFRVDQGKADAEARLERWINLEVEGWHAADEHLHYERTDPRHDDDWLTMMDGDGLAVTHFLVLKGGNLPGVWAEQFAYGPAGEGRDGKRLIRPGEEYRDSTQGHINLLGIDKVVPPISTGGIGQPRVAQNYPPLKDVLQQTHQLGGIGGPAHGGSLARSSTAVLDTVLGQVDFIEIANTHIYKTDVWYQLLNGGFLLPPVAGTDLPNAGFRDPWQPLLGEVRTYVRSGTENNFDSWRQAVVQGKVFVTSGPILRFRVGDVGPGGVVQLPPQGGTVTIRAELASPRPLKTLEIVQMSRTVPMTPNEGYDSGIHRLVIDQEIEITGSCWLAARGTGVSKEAVEQGLGIEQDVVAHSGVVAVRVGEQPIRSEPAVQKLRKQLVDQQEYYRAKAAYRRPEHRARFLSLFDEAIEQLE